MDTAFILNFLSELQKNNSKVWMDSHREQYLQARQYFTELVQFALDELQTLDTSLHNLTPSECMFRINKNDFSKRGEPPYKGRMGAGISQGGRHSLYANYILVLEPGNKSRLGGGMATPSATQLALIREEIDYSPGELEAILANDAFRSNFGEVKGDKLLAAPKGYEKNHPAIELLRHKSFLALRYFSDEQVCSQEFLKQFQPVFNTVKPLHDFLNRTIP